MAVCTKLTNAIYVVSFAITGTSMQKVKDEKKEKKTRKATTDEQRCTQLVNATCPTTSFGLPALPMSLFHRDCFKGWC